MHKYKKIFINYKMKWKARGVIEKKLDCDRMPI